MNVFEMEEELSRLAEELSKHPHSRWRVRKALAYALIALAVWARHAHDHLPHGEDPHAHDADA